MTAERKDVSGERLDDKTERLMTDILRKHALVVTSVEIGSLEWASAVDERKTATTALRARIRELVEEARKNAVPGKLPEPEWEY